MKLAPLGLGSHRLEPCGREHRHANLIGKCFVAVLHDDDHTIGQRRHVRVTLRAKQPTHKPSEQKEEDENESPKTIRRNRPPAQPHETENTCAPKRPVLIVPQSCPRWSCRRSSSCRNSSTCGFSCQRLRLIMVPHTTDIQTTMMCSNLPSSVHVSGVGFVGLYAGCPNLGRCRRGASQR
jgi:hypothetical protein